MKKYICALLLSVFALAAFSGCMVTSDEAVFKSSRNFDIPDISGAFRNAKGHTYLLARVDGTTNTFTLTPPDQQNPMTLTLEPLKTAGRYVVQISSEAGQEVMLGLMGIRDQALDIYVMNLQAVPEAAKKHGATIDENGRVTKRPTNRRFKDFFDACLKDDQCAALMQTVTPGRGQK